MFGCPKSSSNHFVFKCHLETRNKAGRKLGEGVGGKNVRFWRANHSTAHRTGIPGFAVVQQDCLS